MTDRRFYYLVLAYAMLYTYSHGAPQKLVENPIVNTKYGPIKGNVLNSRDGRQFHAFRGIPYARPPVGELRFSSPIPPEPWTTPLDATKDANICLQRNFFFDQFAKSEGSEDCLYLNVYTPQIKTSDTKNEELLPVMVFIHYGGLFSGTGRSTLLGPTYFMDKDIILVTFNYRLGIFGFYSSLDDAAPGNFGFKDQRLALHWVKDNIKEFGGDPSRTTLFGQSAGGGSVHHHILSPSSSGLFQQAISQSGSALNLWARPFNEISAKIFRGSAQIAGCDHTATSETIVDCMRNVSAETLVGIGESFHYFGIEPLNVFGVVMETQSDSNPEPFLTKDPLEIINSGLFQKVPWIIGVVQDEGILRSSPLSRQAANLKILNENFDKLMPQVLLLSISTTENKTAELWKNIKDFYIGDDKIDASKPHTIQGLTNLYTDRSFLWGIYQSALLHSNKGHKPIWFYNLAYKGQLSYGDLFAATNETIDYNWGVSHCDDLLYLFDSPEILPPLPDADLEMSKLYIKMWTNFAKYGKPTINKKCEENCGLGWEPTPAIRDEAPIRNEYLHFLNITGPPIKMEMYNEIHAKRMRFWQSQDVYEKIPIFDN